MNKTNLLLTSLLTLASVSGAYADTTDVYCAKYDGSNWHWLKDNDNYQVSITGYWDDIGGIYFFYVSESDYQRVNTLCQLKFTTQYGAQPANNYLSGWYKFLVLRKVPGPYVPSTGSPEAQL